MALESPSTSTLELPWPALIPLGHHEGKPPIPLKRPVTLVGSRHNAHLHLLSRQVSKAHAVLINSDYKVYIRDLASRTHVYINGDEVQEADLVDGDLVKIGAFTFRFASGPGALRRPRVRPAPEGMLDGGGSQPLYIQQRVILIGRRPNADLPLLDPDVSTAHAIVFDMNGRRYVRDLGSRSGTFVNARQVHQEEISFKDVIRIGPFELRYVPGKIESPMQFGSPDLVEPEDDEIVTGTSPYVPASLPAPSAPPARPAAVEAAGEAPALPIASIEPRLDELAPRPQPVTAQDTAALGADEAIEPVETPEADVSEAAEGSDVAEPPAPTPSEDHTVIATDQQSLLVDATILADKLSSSATYADLQPAADQALTGAIEPPAADDIDIAEPAEVPSELADLPQRGWHAATEPLISLTHEEPAAEAPAPEEVEVAPEEPQPEDAVADELELAAHPVAAPEEAALAEPEAADAASEEAEPEPAEPELAELPLDEALLAEQQVPEQDLEAEIFRAVERTTPREPQALHGEEEALKVLEPMGPRPEMDEPLDLADLALMLPSEPAEPATAEPHDLDLSNLKLDMEAGEAQPMALDPALDLGLLPDAPTEPQAPDEPEPLVQVTPQDLTLPGGTDSATATPFDLEAPTAPEPPVAEAPEPLKPRRRRFGRKKRAVEPVDETPVEESAPVETPAEPLAPGEPEVAAWADEVAELAAPESAPPAPVAEVVDPTAPTPESALDLEPLVTEAAGSAPAPEAFSELTDTTVGRQIEALGEPSGEPLVESSLVESSAVEPSTEPPAETVTPPAPEAPAAPTQPWLEVADPVRQPPAPPAPSQAPPPPAFGEIAPLWGQSFAPGADQVAFFGGLPLRLPELPPEPKVRVVFGSKVISEAYVPRRTPDAEPVAPASPAPAPPRAPEPPPVPVTVQPALQRPAQSIEPGEDLGRFVPAEPSAPVAPADEAAAGLEPAPADEAQPPLEPADIEGALTEEATEEPAESTDEPVDIENLLPQAVSEESLAPVEPDHVEEPAAEHPAEPEAADEAFAELPAEPPLADYAPAEQPADVEKHAAAAEPAAIATPEPPRPLEQKAEPARTAPRRGRHPLTPAVPPRLDNVGYGWAEKRAAALRPARKSRLTLLVLLIGVLLAVLLILVVWTLRPFRPERPLRSSLQYKGVGALNSHVIAGFWDDQRKLLVGKEGEKIQADAIESCRLSGLGAGFLGDPVRLLKIRTEPPAPGGDDGVLVVSYEGDDAADDKRLHWLLQKFIEAQAPADGDPQRRAALELKNKNAELERAMREGRDLKDSKDTLTPIAAARPNADAVSKAADERKILEGVRVAAQKARIELDLTVQGLAAARADPNQPEALAALAPDEQLQGMLRQLADLNNHATGHAQPTSQQTEQARQALDDAMQRFQDSLNKAQGMLKDDPALGEYISAARKLQQATQGVVDDVLRAQADHQEKLAAAKRNLDERVQAQRQRLWDRDPELKSLASMLDLTTRKLNMAQSPGSQVSADEVKKLQAELGTLNDQVKARKMLLGDDPLLADTLSDLQALVETGQRQLEHGRADADKLLRQLEEEMQRTAPAVEKLPQEQKAMADALRQRLATMNAARKAYAQAFDVATTQTTGDIKQIQEEIRVLEQQISARRLQMLDRALKEKQEAQKVAVAAEASAEEAWRTQEAKCDEISKRFDEGQQAQTKLAAIEVKEEQNQAKIAELNEAIRNAGASRAVVVPGGPADVITGNVRDYRPWITIGIVAVVAALASWIAIVGPHSAPQPVLVASDDDEQDSQDVSIDQPAEEDAPA